MTATSSIRAWAASILKWAQDNNLNIIRFCAVDASRSIGQLLNGRLRNDFLDRFTGEAAS